MPAGAGTAPLGALGLRACGDTIPGSRQDCPLPAVRVAARSEAPRLLQPAGLCWHPWLEEAGVRAVLTGPRPCPCDLPDTTQLPYSPKPSHVELQVTGRPSGHFWYLT